MKKGTLAALAAYVMWGFLPAYWKLLQSVPPIEILGHRIVWSLVACTLFLVATRRTAWIKRVISHPAQLAPLVLTALVLGANWGIYIWAVNYGHIVESSLGYFINPLLNVLLGTVFLRERLRSWQWAAIGLAFAAVVYLTLSAGRPPWIALSLALTFGFYGLIRKTAVIDAVEGLTVEMVFLAVPAFAFLITSAGRGTGAFVAAGPATTLLLVFAGVVTALPMALFTIGARRVTLTTLGVLQYAAPSLQFLLGVFVYREDFQPSRLLGFSVIWLALILYTVEGIANQRRTAAALAPQGLP